MLCKRDDVSCRIFLLDEVSSLWHKLLLQGGGALARKDEDLIVYYKCGKIDASSTVLYFRSKQFFVCGIHTRLR